MTPLDRLRAELHAQGLPMHFTDAVAERIAAIVIGGRR